MFDTHKDRSMSLPRDIQTRMEHKIRPPHLSLRHYERNLGTPSTTWHEASSTWGRLGGTLSVSSISLVNLERAQNIAQALKVSHDVQGVKRFPDSALKSSPPTRDELDVNYRRGVEHSIPSPLLPYDHVAAFALFPSSCLSVSINTHTAIRRHHVTTVCYLDFVSIT